jgi:hypothetical protein
MRNRIFLILPLLAPMAVGCGDSGTTADMAMTPTQKDMAMTGPGPDMTMTGPGPDMTMTGPGPDMTMTSSPDMTSTFPAAPTLGATQIDRMGRPGINTAVTDPFDPTKATQDMNKEKYNADSNAAMWVTTWTGAFIKSLTVYDGLDTVCGNQAGYSFGKMNPMTPVDAYGTLGAALADDELYVDTTQMTCALYLGVELKTLGAMVPADCGGRTPTENVIDETYSLLVAGAPAGITNGVTKDADTGPGATFPFLGAPN